MTNIINMINTTDIVDMTSIIASGIIILAVIFDAYTKKIPNELILIGMLVGIANSIYFGGLAGLKNSLIGITLPIIFLIVLFALKMLGAGDIKMFAVVGSFMGAVFALKTILISVMAGGIISVIIVICRKNALERFKYLKNYLLNCFLTRKITEYQSFEKDSDGLFRFSYSIAIGFLIAHIDKNI